MSNRLRQRRRLQLYTVGAMNVAERDDFGYRAWWYRFVDGQDHHRFAARRHTPDVHRRNVDIGFAEQGSYQTDQAGTVAVEGEDHRLRRYQIKPVAVDQDDVRLILHCRAAEGVLFAISSPDAQFQQRGILIGIGLFALADGKPTLARNQR